MKTLLAWIGLALLALVKPAQAQDAQALNIAGVNRVLRSETQRAVRPVVFRGVVRLPEGESVSAAAAVTVIASARRIDFIRLSPWLVVRPLCRKG